MGTIEKTDGELVAASRRGELDAFGHLVARYQGVVCAVGYSSTGDHVLGEDVAQETFIAAWRQLDRVRDAMRLGPWLCGIARNLGRKAKKRTHRELLVEVDEPAATTPSAFDELARRDAERIVRDALARVPEAYREVLVLYYREDRSIRDVAETLRISEDAAMQRLSRARRYLADSVSSLVERSLEGARPRRDLVAAVLAAIVAFAIPARVDASTVKAKGSTMMKLTLVASALAIAGGAAYVVHSHGHTAKVAATAKTQLHYGTRPARPPALGPSTPKHTTASRRTAADDLGYLPADADAVFGIDMAHIQQSPLWQQFIAPGLANAPAIHEFVTTCGFDPIASLSSVSIGVKGFGADTMTGTFVVHGFDKTKVLACIASQSSRATDAGAAMTIDGDVVMIGTPHGDGAALMFIDDTTALVVTGPAAVSKASIEQIAAGNSGLASSPAFGELFGDINSDDPFWLVIAPASPLFGTVNAALAPYTSFKTHALYASVDISGSIALEAGVRLDSPDQATRLVAEIQTQIDSLASGGNLSRYFDQLDVNADNSDVIIGLSANALQLANLATQGSMQGSATAAGSDGPGTFTISAKLGVGE